MTIMPRPPSQTSPDLVVVSPAVNNSSPETGGTFTLSATVQNDGNGASAATTLRYYRSTDATITTSDTEVGTDAVGALAAAGTSSGSVDLTAPATAGTYHYGACVDAVTDESDTTDNCSASVQVTVSEPPAQTAPDLSVGTPTVDDNSPETGGAFALSATVSNDGDGEAAATTLRYYRSTDATITTSDTEVGTDDVSVLLASETTAETIPLTAPSSADTYYYGACVDAVTDESETTNNCSSSVGITVRSSVTPVQGTLDLEAYGLEAFTVGPTPGETFSLSVSVRNNGTGSSAATTLRYYQSTDASVTTSDTQVGTNPVSALAPSGTSTQTLSLSAPSTPGMYYYGACVDSVTNELDTTNNCASAVQVTVVEQQGPSSPLPLVRINSKSGTITEGMSARFEIAATPAPTTDLDIGVSYAETNVTETEIILAYPPVTTTVTISAESSSTTLTVQSVDDTDVDGPGTIRVWLNRNFPGQIIAKRV